jgi:hypothetical protein
MLTCAKVGNLNKKDLGEIRSIIFNRNTNTWNRNLGTALVLCEDTKYLRTP